MTARVKMVTVMRPLLSYHHYSYNRATTIYKHQARASFGAFMALFLASVLTSWNEDLEAADC
jgi:hypothetical protein